MKKAVRNILLLAGLFILMWYVVIQIQWIKRVPYAEELIEKRIDSFKKMSFEEIKGFIGKGYIQENTVINGVTYFMGYVVSKPDTITGVHNNESRQVKAGLEPGEAIGEVEIIGYVDCVSIAPSITMGPSFNIIIDKNGKITRRAPN